MSGERALVVIATSTDSGSTAARGGSKFSPRWPMVLSVASRGPPDYHGTQWAPWGPWIMMVGHSGNNLTGRRVWKPDGTPNCAVQTCRSVREYSNSQSDSKALAALHDADCLDCLVLRLWFRPPIDAIILQLFQ